MPAEIPDGAVLVARALLNSSLWTMRPEDCKLALTCICLANWRPRKWWTGSAEIQIQRGQFVASWDRLSIASQLTVRTVRTSTQNLERVGFLTRSRTARFSVFTIPKYDHYQDLTKYSDSIVAEVGKKADRELTGDRQGADNKQEGKNGRNTHTAPPTGAGVSVENWRKDVENGDDGPEDFLKWWAAYPSGIRKGDRKGALRAWYRLAPSPELAASLIAVVKEQGKSPAWTADEGRYVPRPAKWLESRGWEGTAEVVRARELAEQNRRQRAKEADAARKAELERQQAEAADRAANPEKYAAMQARLEAAVRKLNAGPQPPVLPAKKS